MRNFRTACASLVLAVIALTALGCRMTALTDPIMGPDHQVSNVYRKEPMLPGEVRRVALLPLSARESDANLTAGKQSLEAIVFSELTKKALFELQRVEPSQLKQWTGREQWDAHEALPSTLLRTVVEKTGADAVLFVTLTEYKPYPPILLGWRMRLVTPDAETLWAVEEMFDAAEMPVSNSARRYERDHVRSSPVLENSRSVLLSPARFGQYTLAGLFDTLPNR